MIQHLSFDLWLTLIKSNPLFKQKRAELITERYNPNGLSVELVSNIIKRTDKDYDRINEITGKKVATELMYGSILKELGYGTQLLNYNFLTEFKLQICDLFYQFQPLLLNNNIIQILTQLKQDGYSMNISSNTGFIEGNCLRKTSNLFELFSFFDFMIFSDEINASKPSITFFEYVFMQSKVKKKEIIHIGDNYYVDYMGAKTFGFDALLIEDKEYSIEIIRKKIDEKNREI